RSRSAPLKRCRKLSRKPLRRTDRQHDTMQEGGQEPAFFVLLSSWEGACSLLKGAKQVPEPLPSQDQKPGRCVCGNDLYRVAGSLIGCAEQPAGLKPKNIHGIIKSG